MSNSLYWKMYVLIWLNWTLYYSWLHQVDHEYISIFYFCSCSREIIAIFPCLKNFNVAFSGTLFKQHFSNFAGHNLAWGLGFHCRFDDLDCFKVTNVYQKYALQIVLVRFLNVVWLLHTLRRSRTIWILQLWFVFSGRYFTCFWSVECLGLSETLTLGFAQTP